MPLRQEQVHRPPAPAPEVKFIVKAHILDLEPGDEVDWPVTDEVKDLEASSLIERVSKAKSDEGTG